MKNKLSSFFRSPVWYLLLSATFALLAMPASRLRQIGFGQPPTYVTINLRWVFWFLLIVSVLCLFPLVISYLRILHDRQKLPGFLDFFYRDPFGHLAHTSLRRLQEAAASTLGQLTLIGAGIFVIIVLLSGTNAIDNNQVDFSLYRLAGDLMQRYTKPRGSSVVVQYFLSTFDSTWNNYVDRYEETIRRLKDSGARAVLIDVQTVRGDVFKLMESLEKFGIVVLGMEQGTHFRSWRLDGTERKISRATYTLPSEDRPWVIFIERIRPVASTYEPIGQRYEGGQILDVALELVRKYNDYPQELSAKQEGGHIVFGDYTIPLTNDGWTYVHRTPTALPAYALDTRFGGIFSAQTGHVRAASDTAWKAAQRSFFSERFKNKIVLINENPRNVVFGPPLRDLRYASVIQGIIEKKFVAKSGTGHLWLSLACLAVAAFLAYWFRPLLAILLIFVLAVGTLLLGLYFLDSQKLLIDISYPLLSLAMATVFYPIITITKKMRIGEGVVES